MLHTYYIHTVYIPSMQVNKYVVISHDMQRCNATSGNVMVMQLYGIAWYRKVHAVAIRFPSLNTRSPLVLYSFSCF